MKNIFFIAVLFTFSGVSAQQIALNTQYVFNETSVNPGAVGNRDYIPIHVNFRKQWTKFPGSPTTQNISCHSVIFRKMGFGGAVFNDVAGPYRRTGMNINGAYHLQLDRRKRHILGLGLGISFTQHLIDVNQIVTYLPDDPAVLRGYNHKFVPDVNFGAYYRFKNVAYVGISAYNLAQHKRDLFDFHNVFYNKHVRHYYLSAGTNFDLNRKHGMKISTLVMAIETGTIQFDVTALMTFKNVFWYGIAYRNLDAISAMIGGQYGRVRLGYSYDYTLSDITKYSGGSHEVFLELHLFSEKHQSKAPWFKRTNNGTPKL